MAGGSAAASTSSRKRWRTRHEQSLGLKKLLRRKVALSPFSRIFKVLKSASAQLKIITTKSSQVMNWFLIMPSLNMMVRIFFQFSIISLSAWKLVNLFDGKIRSTVTEIARLLRLRLKRRHDYEPQGSQPSRYRLCEMWLSEKIWLTSNLVPPRFWCGQGVIQSADDVEHSVKSGFSCLSLPLKIIAKIETKSIETDEKWKLSFAADGIMVARGDMAVEAGNEVVPIVQRKLISLCRKHGKICIVVTQMLGSMVIVLVHLALKFLTLPTLWFRVLTPSCFLDDPPTVSIQSKLWSKWSKSFYTQNHSKVDPIDQDVTGENVNTTLLMPPSARWKSFTPMSMFVKLLLVLLLSQFLQNVQIS